MKYINFILIIALSLGVSSISFAAEIPSTSLIPQTQSTFYNLYQGMISAWNEKKNALIATAAIASLLILYKTQKLSIIKWISDIISPTEQSKEGRFLSEEEYPEVLKKLEAERKQPWSKYYYEMLLQKQLQQQQPQESQK